MVRAPHVLWIVLSAGCSGEAPAPTEQLPAPAPADIVELAPEDQLIRASLDLRGIRPSIDELDRLQADPEAMEALIDDYLQDPRFGDRVADLFAEIYLTRTETWFVNLAAYDLGDVPYAQVVESLGEEPLQILAEIARQDLPITELVTADWTMANDVLARMWPLDYPEGQTGWRRAHYTDGRPAAGVLSSNSLWWRYQSTDSNANRKRANVASRILLCHDYLTRPIDFDRNINLLDEEAVADALRTNPSCLNCHVSLDPMAAYFFGFWWFEQSSVEVSSYHPSRERYWEDLLGTPPAYYGQPGSSLSDLGQQIAADNRFPECMVEHVTELLLRRDAELLDFERMTEHREALIQGGLALRPLFKSVLQSPEYRAATDDGLPGTQVPLKMATPALLASQIQDLTGFDWRSVDGYDLLQTDSVGFLTLAGGADGTYAVKNSTSPNTTLLLVQERLAEAAADYVVQLAEGGGSDLLGDIDLSDTPEGDRDAMVATLKRLHLRMFGNRIEDDGPEVEANLELWSDLYALEGDTNKAWAGLLSALLRDPDLLFY
ncbi:MAG TPA: DUF1549 domain-containing protein [Deltaproteobacteria bacterium]|nr:DUF1549 domain-containing protein [Deltaproteobacteria bacterium]